MTKLRGSLWRRPNGTWTLQGEPAWSDGNQTTVRPTIGTYRTEAEGHLAQIEYTATLNRGEYSVDEAAMHRRPLDEYLEDWLTDLEQECQFGQIERRTYLDYRGVTLNHLIPHLRALTIGDLNPATIRKWLLAVRAKEVSDRTVEKAYRILHRALGDSGLPANPVRLPKRHRPRGQDITKKTYPAPDVVRSFIAHLGQCDQPGRSALPLMLVAYTGLRRAEVCGLAWTDLDLDAGTLTVEQTLQVEEQSGLFVKGPKSKFGYRTIGLADPVVAALRAHRSHNNQERLRAGASYHTQPLGHDFVFRLDETGSPLHPDRLTAAMNREWAHSGLSPRTTLHGLRHGVASALILKGMSHTDVASHIGDKPETVMAFYQHELDAAQRRKAVNRVIGELLG